MATAKQLSAKRAIDRTGRTFRIIENGAALGLEKKLTGKEDGFVSVKGKLKNESPVIPAGSLDSTRGTGDVARAGYKRWKLTVAAAAIEFVPTEKTRVVDGATMYAVERPRPVYYVEDLVSYELTLRPL